MSMVRSLWNYRGFVRSSVVREMRLRYTGSVLGGAWQVLSPLAMIAMYSVVFSSLMRARLPGSTDSYSYTVYVCCSLLVWTMFSDILLRSQTMFLENSNLLKKSSFPRSCIPAIVGGSALANFAIVYTIFLVLLIAFGRWPGIVVLAAIVPIAILAALGVAAGVFLGVLNVFFRDVGQVLPILLQVWFWLTPIVYPLEILPEPIQPWIARNPITPLVQALQGVFVQHRSPEWTSLASPTLATLVLIIVSLALFRWQSPWIVDEL